VSAKAVQGAVQVLALVMFFIIVLGVIYFVREYIKAIGLPWPSALDTALSVLVGFVEPIMTPPDIRGLVVLIAIFIIALGLLLRLGGPGAGR
jgi:Na+-driven multidrug efflux pump